jgi:acyl carrier protein
MSGKDVIDRLRVVAAGVLGVDATMIADDGKLVGYGLDSVKVVELVMEIEEEFGIELSEHDPALRDVHTLAQLAALVAERL